MTRPAVFTTWILLAGESRLGQGTMLIAVIEHAICVPVPEKAQRQYNFCIFPKPAHGSSEQSTDTKPDAIVWTVPDKPPETATGELAKSGENSYRSLLIGVLNSRLPSNLTVVEPNDKEFVSGIVHAHRKDEKATHVRAVRGTKDGIITFKSAFSHQILIITSFQASSISSPPASFGAFENLYCSSLLWKSVRFHILQYYNALSISISLLQLQFSVKLRTLEQSRAIIQNISSP